MMPLPCPLNRALLLGPHVRGALSRKAETALGDDVALDVGGAASGCDSQRPDVIAEPRFVLAPLKNEMNCSCKLKYLGSKLPRDFCEPAVNLQKQN